METNPIMKGGSNMDLKKGLLITAAGVAISIMSSVIDDKKMESAAEKAVAKALDSTTSD